MWLRLLTWFFWTLSGLVVGGDAVGCCQRLVGAVAFWAGAALAVLLFDAERLVESLA